MKSSWQNVENLAAQHTMGHGCVESSVQIAKPAAKAAKGSHVGKPAEDLAAKHPMGRGVIAAAAEAMKKTR